MTAREIFKFIKKSKKLKNIDLAKRVYNLDENSNEEELKKALDNIKKRTSTKNIKTDNLIELINALDYEVVIQPKSLTGKRPIDYIKIDREER